jgi:hypothetical protein
MVHSHSHTRRLRRPNNDVQLLHNYYLRNVRNASLTSMAVYLGSRVGCYQTLVYVMQRTYMRCSQSALFLCLWTWPLARVTPAGGRPTGTACYPYGFADILPRRGRMEDFTDWCTCWCLERARARTHTHTHTYLFAAAGRLAGYRSFLGPHRSIPWTAEQRESGWLIRKHALSHIIPDCQVRIPAIAFEVFRGFPQFLQSNTAILRWFDSHCFFLISWPMIYLRRYVKRYTDSIV